MNKGIESLILTTMGMTNGSHGNINCDRNINF